MPKEEGIAARNETNSKLYPAITALIEERQRNLGAISPCISSKACEHIQVRTGKCQVCVVMVFGNASISGFPPMEDVFYNVENIFHLAAHTGLSMLLFLLLLPRQAASIVPPESSALTIDLVAAQLSI